MITARLATRTPWGYAGANPGLVLRGLGTGGSGGSKTLDDQVRSSIDSFNEKYGAASAAVGQGVDYVTRAAHAQTAEDGARAALDGACAAAELAGVGSACRTVSKAIMALVGWLTNTWPATAYYPDPEVYKIAASKAGYKGDYTKMSADGWIILWRDDRTSGGVRANLVRGAQQTLIAHFVAPVSNVEPSASPIRESPTLFQLADLERKSATQELATGLERAFPGWLDRWSGLQAAGAFYFNGNVGAYGVAGIAIKYDQLPTLLQDLLKYGFLAPSSEMPDNLARRIRNTAGIVATDGTTQYQSPFLAFLAQKSFDAFAARGIVARLPLLKRSVALPFARYLTVGGRQVKYTETSRQGTKLRLSIAETLAPGVTTLVLGGKTYRCTCRQSAAGVECDCG
jgi:hypothetical protein